MGLELVELVMALEEHFGIEIPDAEAVKLTTPNLVINYISGQLTLTETKVCQSQRAFYLLRRAIMKIMGKQRNELTPKTELFNLTNSHDCSAWWTQLKDEVGAREWPALVRPFWMERSIFYLSLSILFAFSAITYFTKFTILGVGILLGIISASAFAILMSLATRPWKTHHPRDLICLSDLIWFVETSDEISWNRELISHILQFVFCHYLRPSDLIWLRFSQLFVVAGSNRGRCGIREIGIPLRWHPSL